MKMHFDAATVRRLLDHVQAVPVRSPTMDQMFEGACRRDGRDIETARLTLDTWPGAEDVDPARLPIGLWLVGDGGVYLMSPGRPGLREDGSAGHVVARSEETDRAHAPETWYDNKVRAFGGDDGVVFLGVDLVEAALRMMRDGRMALAVTPRQIGTAAPDLRPQIPRAAR